jgi:hypothetical protein
MPAEPCAGCVTYTVTYRNLLGGATVRGQAGALPEWFQTLASALEETFSDAELATSPALTPSPTLTVTLAATDTTSLATPRAADRHPDRAGLRGGLHRRNAAV